MDSYDATKTWRKFVEKTYFRGGEQDVYDVFEWRDYHKEVDGGRYQVWTNGRRSGNYIPPDSSVASAGAGARVGVLLRQLEALR